MLHTPADKFRNRPWDNIQLVAVNRDVTETLGSCALGAVANCWPEGL